MGKPIQLEDPALDASDPQTRNFLLAEYWRSKYAELKAAQPPAFRGYAAMGAGAYLLTVCDGDERGPELVIALASEDEKVGRTVGDLGDVVKGEEIPLDKIAIRLQFMSHDGLKALEQQLAFVRNELDKRFGAAASRATPAHQ